MTHTVESDLDPDEGYLIWRYGWQPEVQCHHVLCRLGRFFYGDQGRAWFEKLTGIAVADPPDRVLVSDVHAKGSYLDGWDEAADGNAIAFQFGLTPARWPVEWGGHLELLDGRDGPLVQRLSPSWNGLDVFDVRRPGPWRRVPIVTRHLDGFTVTGWYRPAS